MLLYIVSLLLFALPMQAQDSDVSGAAGTDFYFTTFEHSSDQQLMMQMIVAGSNTTVATYYVNGKKQYVNSDPFAASIGRPFTPHPMDVIHVTTTEPCFLSAFVVGSTSGAETAILPTRLLGTSYMLQGVPGALIELDGVPTQTYSQFSVVGTDNNTKVTIHSPVNLTCLSTGQTIPADSKATFSLSADQALFFQPVDYTKDISGVRVKATHPVAVFQGNNLTRITPGANWADFTWEQARPTATCGTEFIVPKSGLLKYNITKLTMLEDNTEVYRWNNGTQIYVGTFNAGQSYATSIDTYNPTLAAVHLRTSKPACCYLYCTGSTMNNDVGDPAMVEITPMDRPSTNTRWITVNPANNSPYYTRLLVTMKAEDSLNVKMNGGPMRVYGEAVTRCITDDYITYEMAHSAAQTMKLTTSGGGFSAYTLQVGQTAEANAFNVSIYETPPPPELCLDGVLLFREDFGGNDPSDPVVSTTPVSGMSSSFRQITNLETKGNNNDMGAGRYLVAKRGYRNSTLQDYSVWHIMDDHTHFGDTTRGYFMEVDGKVGGSDVFYSTTLDDLCAGTQLSFSAYVANVTTAGQYNAWRTGRGYVHPKLKFVIKNPQNNEIVAQYSTDTIAHDWSLFGVPSAWRQTANWQQVGMNFIVPEGVNKLTLSILNNANGDTGNDFAIDDIEVRLCAPPVTIFAPDTVCVDTKNSFIAQFENDDTFTEPLEYQWYFSADSLSWTAIQDGTEREWKFKAKPRHTGWYKVAVAGAGNINSSNCRSESEPFYLYVIEDCPPILCPEGYLLFREEYNGAATTLCDTILRDLCADLDLSFVVNLPAGHDDTRLLLRLFDPSTGEELAIYDTGDVPSDSLQVGTNFSIPEGLSELRWTIRNNAAGGAGQPFMLEDIEVRLCIEPIAVSSENPVCRKKPHTFQAVYDNYGILESPEYRWEFSPDSVTWTALQTSAERTFIIPELHRSNEGWYRVMVANAGNMDQPNCRGESEPFRLSTMYCNTATDVFFDTVACDTMLTYHLSWRGHEWDSVGTAIDTLRDIDRDDSLYIHLTMDSKVCCPDIVYIRMDSAVCDTLMPFLWFYRDTMLLFTEIGQQELSFPHYKWETCTGEIHILALDTFHCERLYPIIVNKYNWQLLFDNVALRRYFPGRTVLGFQWYKDEQPVTGANEDDYAEQNELRGVFQLRVQLDQAVDDDDEYVWSNIIEIDDTETPQPVHVRIYDSHGFLIPESRLTQGVYLFRYEQGGHVWTEKKFIP